MLKGTEAFCCLGVLCDISDIGVWDARVLGKYWAGGQCDVGGMPPVPVTDQIEGLTGHMVNTLISMNDIECKTFNEIADFLEKELVHEPLGNDQRAESPV